VSEGASISSIHQSDGGQYGQYAGQRQDFQQYGQQTDQYGPHYGKGPKGYQRSPEGLKEQVCDRLESDGYLDASEIEVEVKNCEVTLSGKVASREEKRQAERCAESISGVKDVHNHLTVDDNLGKGWQSNQRAESGRTLQSGGTKSKETNIT
jgi:osmotically-inducible protein OsmY